MLVNPKQTVGGVDVRSVNKKGPNEREGDHDNFFEGDDNFGKTPLGLPRARRIRGAVTSYLVLIMLLLSGSWSLKRRVARY